MSDICFSEDGLYNGTIREIEDELGIPSLTLFPTNNITTRKHKEITLIAAYRDMLEGGKPQLFFYARTSMTSDEIQMAFNEINKQIRKTKTKDKRKSNETVLSTDGDSLLFMDIDDIEKCEVYSDKIIHNGSVMMMLPSATACVSMFAQYLRADKQPKIMYNMPVCESFTKSKDGIDDHCEDGIFTGKRYVAIIDGTTSKDSTMIIDDSRQKTPGRIAMEVLLREFEQLDNMKKLKKEKESNKSDAEIILEQLNNALKLYRARNNISTSLSASVVFYDRRNKTIVSYGDCKYRVGDIIVNEEKKQIDVELEIKRAAVINQALEKGKAIEELLKMQIPLQRHAFSANGGMVIPE